MTRKRLVDERALLIERKTALDVEIAGLKARKAGMARWATDYRDVSRRLASLGKQSQKAQARLGELAREERAEREANQRCFERSFVAAAKRLLDRETFERLLVAAADDPAGPGD